MGAIIIAFKTIETKDCSIKKGGIYKVWGDNHGAFIQDERNEDVYLADISGWDYTLIEEEDRFEERDKLFSELLKLGVADAEAEEMLSSHSLEFVTEFVSVVKAYNFHLSYDSVTV